MVQQGCKIMTDVNKCDALDLIEFANAWCALGEYTQVQVETALDLHGDDKEVDASAIQNARIKLRGLNADIDKGLDDWQQRTMDRLTKEVDELEKRKAAGMRFGIWCVRLATSRAGPAENWMKADGKELWFATESEAREYLEAHLPKQSLNVVYEVCPR